jgi:hypothetical protein
MEALDFCVLLHGILFILEEEEQREALECMEGALDYLLRMLESMNFVMKEGGNMCPSVSTRIP